MNPYLEFIDELNELKNSDRAMLSALESVRAEQITRIFDNGLDGNDQPIGSYSTEPISISKKNQARNTGQTYFPGGYKEYKGKAGFDNSKVNLVNTGQMRDDWSIIPQGLKTYGMGFKNELNGDKADGQEKHFGKPIFAHSPNDDKVFDKALQTELDRIFK